MSSNDEVIRLRRVGWVHPDDPTLFWHMGAVTREHAKQLGLEPAFVAVKTRVRSAVAKPAYECPPCPREKLVDMYHEHCPTLDRALWDSDARNAAMGARWREVCSRGKLGADEALEFFRLFFVNVGKSEFLTGRAKPGPGRDKSFKADLSWLMGPKNFTKVLERKGYQD